MKQFFKMMFASTLGVLLASGILMFFSFFFFLAIISSVSKTSSVSDYSPSSNTVFKLTLSGPIKEITEENPFGFITGEQSKELALNEILKAIELAKYNKNIKGIYLEAGVISTGTANIDAIRRALLDFKESGKFIIAYSDSYTQGTYYLCSVADKLILNPQGVLNITGLVSQTVFYKGLLEKIGIDMMVFKVGTYKGAVEPFMLDKLSDANREQISSYQQSIWGNVTKGIAQSRNISVDEVNRFANEGLAFAGAEEAVNTGLIDELMYRSDAEEYVRKRAGQTGEKLKSAGLDKIKNLKDNRQSKSGDQIAILYAEGEIMPERPASIYGTEQVISERIAQELIKLKNNDDIKAVVFRVNSPGGSAYISEQIWHQVKELKETKPIVVSMGSVAASGGYYISCAADKIVAEPNTITGSIGIFGLFPNATGLFEKLDVTTDIVKTNTYADLLDISRPMREDEKALIQNYIERGYATFLSRCAEGRNMSMEQIDEVGQGRVWTGEQALIRGLVDDLGGIDKAIEIAASLGGLEKYRVVPVKPSRDILSEILDKQMSKFKYSLVEDALGDDFEFYRTLHTIRSNSGIQARLPYDLITY